MQKRVLAAVLLVAAAAAAAGYLFYQRAGEARRQLTLYGNVDIRDVSLAFRVAGRVAEVAVDEGDSVKAGQVLARLDPEPLRHNLDNARAAVDALSARNALMRKGNRSEDVEQARARQAAAQAALAQAEQELARQAGLAPEGATSRQSLDVARSQRDQAAAQLRAASEQFKAMERGFRPEEIAESDAQLKQARANLDSAGLALRDAVLQAPSDGMILTRAIEKGSMVQAGAPAFSLSLRKPVWARAYVSETQLGHFSSGTRVLLRGDTHPDKEYRGVVGFVSTTAEFTPKSVETADLRTSLVYRIRVVVSDPDEQLTQGMPVTIRRAP